MGENFSRFLSFESLSLTALFCQAEVFEVVRGYSFRTAIYNRLLLNNLSRQPFVVIFTLCKYQNYLHMKTSALCAYTLLFFGIFISAQSFAGNIAGAHISYRALDSVNYEVTVKIYTDCNFSGSIADSIKVSWTGGSYMSPITFDNTTDVTGIYSGCSILSKCAGGTLYGYNQHIYKATINLSGTDCKVTISWQGGQRSSGITTGAANTDTYIFAEVNKCLGLNNSAHTTQPPRFLIAVGQDAALSTGYIDTADGDSLAFSLVSPQSAPGTDVSYSGSWSAAKPVTFLGFPNANLNSPAGFHFDNQTSEISFRPTVQNQFSALVIEAKEYRNINGNMEEIGRTRLEYTIYVASSPANKWPVVTGIPSTACAGRQMCFTISTNDADAGDTTQVDWNSSLKNAQFSIDNSKRLKTATLCWTPTQNDLRNWPHLVTVNVADNSCNTSGHNSRTFAIYVKPATNPAYFQVASKDVSCNRLRIKMQTPVTAPVVRNFFAPDGFFKAVSKDSAEIYFTKNGWNRFGIRVMENCADTLWDSVFIQPPYQLQLQTTPDTMVCPNDSFTVVAHPINGTAPYTFAWFPLAGNTQSYTLALPGGPLTLRPRVIDSMGCVASDSVKITVHKTQIAKFTYKDTVCSDEQPFTINANPPGGSWQGPAIAGGQFNPPLAGIGRNNAFYTFNDSNNCVVKQVTPVFVIESPQPQFIANITVGQKPLTVNFTNQTPSTPIVTKWTWRFINSGSGDTDSSSSSNPTHIFTDTGKYDVILTAFSGRCVSSAAKTKYIIVGPLSGIGAPQANNLKVYPNPASNTITLSTTAEIQQLILTDMLGRNQLLTVNSRNEVSLSTVAEGLYILHATDINGAGYFAKVLVQR